MINVEAIKKDIHESGNECYSALLTFEQIEALNNLFNSVQRVAESFVNDDDLPDRARNMPEDENSTYERVRYVMFQKCLKDAMNELGALLSVYSGLSNKMIDELAEKSHVTVQELLLHIMLGDIIDHLGKKNKD